MACTRSPIPPDGLVSRVIKYLSTSGSVSVETDNLDCSCLDPSRASMPLRTSGPDRHVGRLPKHLTVMNSGAIYSARMQSVVSSMGIPHHRCQMTLLRALILPPMLPSWASRARDSCSAGNQVADPSGNSTVRCPLAPVLTAHSSRLDPFASQGCTRKHGRLLRSMTFPNHKHCSYLELE